MDYAYLGSAPTDEECVAVVSGTDYMIPMKEEAKRFLRLLQRRFCNLPGGKFLVKTVQHEFGPYVDVVYMFDEADDMQRRAAVFIEDHLPRSWNDNEVFDVMVEVKHGAAEGSADKC